MKKDVYESALEPMQKELVGMARWARTTGQRIVVLFEGRDTAGKGGAIKAVRDRLNPRQCRIVALAKPTEAERSQWYFQRYVEHLPVDEITSLLGLTDKSGARGVLQRCKRKLKRELSRRLAELGHGTSFVRGSLD